MANLFRRTICIVCFSFLQQLDRGGGDGGYRQTDRLSRWLTHSPVPINLWLSLQLFLTWTRWPNHRATLKPIWLENSHRWQFIPGTLPEQHTNTADTKKHTPIHTYSCVLVTLSIYAHSNIKLTLLQHLTCSYSTIRLHEHIISTCWMHGTRSK